MEFNKNQSNIIRNFQKYRKMRCPRFPKGRQKSDHVNGKEVLELKAAESTTIENTLKTEKKYDVTSFLVDVTSSVNLPGDTKIGENSSESVCNGLSRKSCKNDIPTANIDVLKPMNKQPDDTNVEGNYLRIKVLTVLELVTSILEEMNLEAAVLDKSDAQNKLQVLNDVINSIEKELLSSCIKGENLNHSSLYQDIVSVKLLVKDRELEMDPGLVRPKSWHKRRWEEMKLVGREGEVKGERKKYKKSALKREYKKKIAEKYNIPIHFFFPENEKMSTKTMAPAKQTQEAQEEDYMDDLITLVHDDEQPGEPAEENSSSDVEYVGTIVNNMKKEEAGKVEVTPSVPEKDGAIPATSAYGEKHLDKNSLSVIFFDSSRNVQLLTECRPLSVQVVDFVKHPPRAHKSRVLASKTRKPPYRSHLSLNKSSIKIDLIETSNNFFSCTLKQNNVLKIVKNKSFPDLPPADIFNPASGESLSKDSKKNNTVLGGEVSAVELKMKTKNGDVSPKTIDFKKNKGLVGLKITNRILKVEPKQNPNAAKNPNNNFVGYKVLKSDSVKPKLPQAKKTEKVTKVSKKGNFVTSRFNKTCKTYSKKYIKSNNHKPTEIGTKIKGKVEVSSSKDNCNNQISNVQQSAPTLPVEIKKQRNEDTDNSIQCIKIPTDSKKIREVSIKCRLKLDPHIAPKFMKKLNEEAKADHRLSISSSCKDLKNENNSGGGSLKRQNVSYTTTKNRSNHETSNDLKNEVNQKINNTNVCSTVMKAKFVEDTYTERDKNTNVEVQNETVQLINVSKLCDPNVQSVSQKLKFNEETDNKIQMQSEQKHNAFKMSDVMVQINQQKTKSDEKNNVETQNEVNQNPLLSKTVPQKVKCNEGSNVKVQNERHQSFNVSKMCNLKVQTAPQSDKNNEEKNEKVLNERDQSLDVSKMSDLKVQTVPPKAKHNEANDIKAQNEKNQSFDVSNMCDLKVQTVSQINDSFTKVETSGITTNNSQLDNVGPTVSKQISEITKIKTQNEIKKEYDDITGTCVPSQNILGNNLVQRANIDEGNVNSADVRPMSQINGNAISAVKDPAVLTSDVKSCAADSTLLSPSPPNQSIVSPMTHDVSSVLKTQHNLSSFTPTLPHLSVVRSPHNVISVRRTTHDAVGSITPANNTHQANNPHESANRVPRFWLQPSEIRPPPMQKSNSSNKRNNPSLNQAILLPNVNNPPPSQHMFPINEMQHHPIPHWQQRNELINMNMPPYYNNSQTPNSELLMQWQQPAQSENQMPLFMHQGNSDHILYNSHLPPMNDNSYTNPLLNDGRYYFTPPPPLPPPPPSLPQTPSQAHCKIATHRNCNNNKGINDSPILFKNSSSVAGSARQTLKPEISHKISGTCKGKTLPVIVNSLNKLASTRVDVKQPNEGNLGNIFKVDEKKDTTLRGLTLKRAANTCINSEASKKIRLIPQQTSAKRFIRLNSETRASCTDNNLMSKGYSPPILPIPTLSKSIELMQILNSMHNKSNTVDKTAKSVTKSKKTHVVCRPHGIIKKVSLENTPKNKQPLSTYSIKKISLEEYKKRISKDAEKIIDLTVDEKRSIELHGEADKLRLDRVGNVERQSVDSQDLGYDSDSTVKL